MTISLLHSFVSAIADDALSVIAGEVVPSNWNAEHTLTMATSKLLGRSTAGTGAVEEISIGSGLSLSGGSLSATGSGSIGGSTGSTDNALLRADGTGGATIQSSDWTLSDATGTLGVPSGAAISWNAGDVTLTHSSNLLSMAGGALDVEGASMGSAVATLRVDSNAVETFPDGWGNTVKLVADRYPALWFHGTTDNVGVVYAWSAAQNKFWLEGLSGTTATGETLLWDFSAKHYTPASGATRWNLGQDTNPWGTAWVRQGDFTITSGFGNTGVTGFPVLHVNSLDRVGFPNGWGSGVKVTANLYPALWLHGTTNNRGVIYAYDTSTEIFWMERTSGGGLSGDGNDLYWDMANADYYPAASEWDLGKSANPWGTCWLDNFIAIKDGVTAPSATTGYAKIYVDTADGDLKVIFGDGTVKTIVIDT